MLATVRLTTLRPTLTAWTLLALCSFGAALSAAENTAEAPTPAAPTLIAAPQPDAVRSRVTEWISGQGITDKAVLEPIGTLWGFGTEPRTPEELLDLVLQSFALADPETREFLAACNLDQPGLVPPEPKPLQRDGMSPFFTANLSLHYGRYLAHRQMYDEALAVLEPLSPADVVDPPSLLFFTAVCQHHLLLKTEGLKTINQLLHSTEAVPVRYATVAALMEYDLQALQEKSLNEVSRKMSDVERRLNLGRAGQKVQKKEDEIVATLDELIKKIEEQSGGGGGGGSGDGSGKSNQPGSPASDSVVKGSTAPGDVDKKKFKNQGGWGALPPKARAKAKDLIARDFPAHYREAIEEFTRKQATRAATNRK